MTATTTSSRAGRDLRAERKRAGLTRVQLAALVGCSLAQLANIEQGAIPKRSRVLEDAFAALADQHDDDPAPSPGRVEESAGQGRHVPG